jgi:hypothetical protein
MENLDRFWTVKALQALDGLLWGLSCWVLFTMLQNLANPLRKRWVWWVIAFVVWIGMKFVWAGLMAAVHA